MAQMASGAKMIASGSFVAQTTATSIEIDTGATGWKHMLVAIKTLPIDLISRALALRYINLEGDICTQIYASSAGQARPANASSYNTTDGFFTINGTKIKWNGIASQVGTFVEGYEYEWFCW